MTPRPFSTASFRNWKHLDPAGYKNIVWLLDFCPRAESKASYKKMTSGWKFQPVNKNPWKSDHWTSPACLVLWLLFLPFFFQFLISLSSFLSLLSHLLSSLSLFRLSLVSWCHSLPPVSLSVFVSLALHIFSPWPERGFLHWKGPWPAFEGLWRGQSWWATLSLFGLLRQASLFKESAFRTWPHKEPFHSGSPISLLELRHFQTDNHQASYRKLKTLVLCGCLPHLCGPLSFTKGFAALLCDRTHLW